MIGFLLFVFGTTLLVIGFCHARSKPVGNKQAKRDRIETERQALETMTKRFGKERADQIMIERDYYREQNKLIRPKGRRYWFDVKTGEWKLIFKGDPLFYE